MYDCLSTNKNYVHKGMEAEVIVKEMGQSKQRLPHFLNIEYYMLLVNNKFYFGCQIQTICSYIKNLCILCGAYNDNSIHVFSSLG